MLILSILSSRVVSSYQVYCLQNKIYFGNEFILGRIKLITCLSSEVFEKIGEGGGFFIYFLFFGGENF